MKKFKCAVLSLVLLLAMLPTSVFADTREVQVEAHIAEQWTVILPTSISLGSSTSKDYNITVKGDVLDDTSITVTPDSPFTMTDLLEHTVNATVTQDVTKWTSDMINVTEGTTKSGTISLESLPAGEWSGSLSFDIEQKVHYEPGLYTSDGSTLKIPWDELLADNTLKVNSGILKSGYNSSTGSNSSSTILDGMLVISEDVTAIGSHGLIGCKNLTSVLVPDTVNTIYDYAFYGCTNLQSIELPDRLSGLAYYTFYECKSLTSIKIPQGLDTIPMSAFYGCTNLESVILPDTITTIKDRAFSDCSNLRSINLPNSITSIGELAFSDCKKLELTNLPSSLDTIGSQAFNWCWDISITELPVGITCINNKAFNNCKNITSLTIPSSVTMIGDGAFSYCTSLTSITIPESVTTIGASAFYNTPWLTAKQEGNPLVVVNGILIDGSTASGDVYIPDNIIDIAEYAFKDSTTVTGITIPGSITNIRFGTFRNCTQLTSVIIPESVTNIEAYAFEGCTSLSSLDIPSTVTTIANGAFNNVSNVYYDGSATGSPWGALAINGVPVE